MVTIDLLRRIFSISFEPDATLRTFMSRAQTQADSTAEVTAAVPDARESARLFGVPLARRGIQPVYLRIVNRGQQPLRLYLLALDPNYFTPLEAAAANHFSILKRLTALGLLGVIFLPLFALLIPFKLFAAYRANARMDELFQTSAFHLRPIPSQGVAEGFVFTPFDAGTKVVRICLHSAAGSLTHFIAAGAAAPPAAAPNTAPAAPRIAPAAPQIVPAESEIGGVADRLVADFTFAIAVPGIAADHLRRDFSEICPPDTIIDCDVPKLAEKLREMPPTTANRLETRHGDPLNLVVIGEFGTLLTVFAPRWDESETITLATCWKTAAAFVLGSQYRYSPVSPLYLFGRSQDVALQRIRHSINDRLHLRLWMSQLRFQGLPVWVGQISRDIGVRFTTSTWNLTTHRVNPDVDEARDYIVEDLLAAEHVQAVAYVDGVGACQPESPRRNLTGDPYYTDGKRAVVLISEARAKPRVVLWG
jgi:hypothetical protein